MTDVARSAGVSVATVSKVVNGRHGVAPTTAARVHRVIDDLGFESSLIARSLRSQRTNVIGILVAEFEPFSAEILKGASAGIAGSGYELLAYSGGGRAGSTVGWERRYLSRLGGTLIDGAVLVTPTVVETGQSLPVVAIDPHTGRCGLPTVDSDNHAGALAATRHLIELGHRRIGFLGGRPDLQSSGERESGFRQAMADAGLEVDPALVRVAGYRQQSTHAPATQLLTLADRPTALFAANDCSALGAIEVAAHLGLTVPHDLSVIGFDDVPEASTAATPLTTVRQPIRQMGVVAIELLVALIGGKDGVPAHVRLPTELVVRGTTSRR